MGATASTVADASRVGALECRRIGPESKNCFPRRISGCDAGWLYSGFVAATSSTADAESRAPSFDVIEMVAISVSSLNCCVARGLNLLLRDCVSRFSGIRSDRRCRNRKLKVSKARTSLPLSSSGFMFSDCSPGNLESLLQAGQDSIELGIILEAVQQGIVESKWQVQEGPMGQVSIEVLISLVLPPDAAIGPSNIEMHVPWNVRLARPLKAF
jgi:hypothetical protein